MSANLIPLLFFLTQSMVFLAQGKLTQFPQTFRFGAATSSFQIEGAWNLSGKGVSIWDVGTHEMNNKIVDGSNADIACDSYHRFMEDIDMLKQLKVQFYRLSISWTRLCPNGYPNMVNPDGVRYYNELLNALIKNGIEPMVTLYHWDLPQTLQDLGGWANPNMADIFTEYADLVFQLFGDRVKSWSTLNEPSHVCANGYDGINAPFLTEDGIGTYLCGHTLIRAHGKIYRLYQRKYKAKQNGKLGISTETSWYEPYNATSVEDRQTIDQYLQMYFGWFVHPIYSKEGDYPPAMRKRIDYASKVQGYSESRLPYFTKDELEEIRGSYDFLGLNHYTTNLVTSANQPIEPIPSFANDVNVILGLDPQWEVEAGRSNFAVVPWGIRRLLKYINDNYGYDLQIEITENGYAGDLNEDPKDAARVNYLKSYVQEVLNAMNDGCNVTAYTYWSLMDNFEWTNGYTLKFGLYNVDFDSPSRTRTARPSAMVYKNIIANRRVDPDDTGLNYISNFGSQSYENY